MYQSITPEQLSQLMGSHPIIIDVRDPYQYKASHIPTAINIPYQMLIMYPERYLTKEDTYFLVCQNGSTSQRACQMLSMSGYKTVSIAGGQSMWRFRRF
ncbi:MAG: rhodanese-like domain-containing protein [Turicibacter sp.]